MFRLTQMSVHVLRHLPADVMRLRRPADEFSCFWGENTLKKIKHLNHTRKQPLVNITKGLRATGAVFEKSTPAKLLPRFLHRLPSSSQPCEDSGLVGFRGLQSPKFRLVSSTSSDCDGRVFNDSEDEDEDDGQHERPMLRTRRMDDQDAYFYAKGHIHKVVRVWKKFGTGIQDRQAMDEKIWTNEDDVFIEAKRYATLKEAYHINYGEESIKSKVVGIWFFSDLEQNTVAQLKLSDVEHKVVVHLISGRRYAYKLL